VWALTELMGGSGPAHFDARFDRYLPHLRI
jgi:hypothetical protein